MDNWSSKTKNIILILKNLIKSIDKVLLVPVPNQDSWSLSDISKISDRKLDNFIEFTNFKEAFYYLKKLEEWPRCIPVLTGSIFLVSEFIKFSKTN